MKVAITAQGTTLDAQVDSRFGRAKYFAVMDTEQDTFDCIDNGQNLNAAQGAGIQAAQNVADLNVDALITGHCGPKAFRTLSAANVKIFVGASGTVREAFEMYKNGELKQADQADVESHW
jgi:predicted Fe-Mo cluster-binding NifX family protein